MGFFDKIVSGVSKITEVVTKPVGDFVKDAALRLGLPAEIADILSMAMDPTKLAKDVAAKMMDEVCEKLGVPEETRKRLKGLIENPEKLVMAFAQGGVGGVIKEMGAALGIDPKLLDAISLVVNVATQNYAAAAIDATRLAKEAAKQLGLPPELQAAVNITADVIARDHESLKQSVGEAALVASERIDMSDEARLALRAGVHTATGNTAAARQDGIDYVKDKAKDIIPAPLQGLANEKIDSLAASYLPPEDDDKLEEERNRQVRG